MSTVYNVEQPRVQTHKNPSPFLLPQNSSSDRRRARQGTLQYQRVDYELTPEALPGERGEDFRLPPHILRLPKTESLTWERTARRWAQLLRIACNKGAVYGMALGRRMNSARAYRRLYRVIPVPEVANFWDSDEEFSAQRLVGPNPMLIRRCTSRPSSHLAKAAEPILKGHDSSLESALSHKRLFECDLGILTDERVQRHVRTADSQLAGPTSLYYLTDRNRLSPLAIGFDLQGESPSVVTPQSGQTNWTMARFHAQSADLHYQIAVSHFLETHMVSEVFWVCACRQLHPNHPISQLLAPHFEATLASGDYLRRRILRANGPLKKCMAAGPAGLLNLARIIWADWSFDKRSLHADLKSRGILPGDGDLPEAWYGPDALAVWEALHCYVRSVLQDWYREDEDEDVLNDYELQSWAQEVASHEGGQIPGFPSAIENRKQLFELLTEVIFRASAQHAAVSNTQFEFLAFPPNAPGMVLGEIPRAAGEAANGDNPFRALPSMSRSLTQIKLHWLMSEPTHRSLLSPRAGPAFTEESAFGAYHAVGALRRDLLAITEEIRQRNFANAFPYSALDADDIACSTAV